MTARPEPKRRNKTKVVSDAPYRLHDDFVKRAQTIQASHNWDRATLAKAMSADGRSISEDGRSISEDDLFKALTGMRMGDAKLSQIEIAIIQLEAHPPTPAEHIKLLWIAIQTLERTKERKAGQ